MLAVIGGTGLSRLTDFTDQSQLPVKTPFDDSPVIVNLVRCEGGDFLFLPRHGEGHKVPPHKINYRANLKALEHLGASRIIAVNAVGGIGPGMGPGAFCVPDQIIDYSWGREHTFFSGGAAGVNHVDFTEPYDESARALLLKAAAQANQSEPRRRTVLDGGVYGCTQGPRLETAAEIRRLRQDGCTMVGMTGMPEAGLARELDLPYACIALSVNWAPGLDDAPLDVRVMQGVVEEGVEFIGRLIRECARLAGEADRA